LVVDKRPRRCADGALLFAEERINRKKIHAIKPEGHGGIVDDALGTAYSRVGLSSRAGSFSFWAEAICSSAPVASAASQVFTRASHRIYGL